MQHGASSSRYNPAIRFALCCRFRPIAKYLAHTHTRLVQLGLRISDRTFQQAGDLPVFIAIYFVEQEDSSVAVRQLPNRPGKRDPVNASYQALVVASVFAFFCLALIAGGLIERYLRPSAFTEIH